jgi:hypothetical protein
MTKRPTRNAGCHPHNDSRHQQPNNVGSDIRRTPFEAEEDSSIQGDPNKCEADHRGNGANTSTYEDLTGYDRLQSDS